MSRILRETISLCPVCLQRIPARHIQREDNVYMEKTCPGHGDFSAVIWRDSPEMDYWRGDMEILTQPPPCPDGCGLCDQHIRGTCCVLLEVTGRCNLNCAWCMAGNAIEENDPPLEELKLQVKTLADSGQTFLQLSGGEPTLRDDLPQLVRYAFECGFRYVQLNTNGLRLARDEAYVRSMAEAGLSFVFLQFDGTRDDIHQTMRGRPLLEQKRRTVELCDRYHIGVTLVPTLVPGINTDDIGNLVRLAVSLSPAVRGIHFHTVGYFGRYPQPPSDDMRITLPEVVRAVEQQTDGLVRAENLWPSRCDHPMCGFHGDFAVMPDRSLQPLGRNNDDNCCGPSTPQANQNFVGRRWKRSQETCCGRDGPDLKSFEGFLDYVKTNGFTVTSMSFQDCYTIDLERLRQCSLHICSEGRLMPLCARYLTPEAHV